MSMKSNHADNLQRCHLHVYLIHVKAQEVKSYLIMLCDRMTGTGLSQSDTVTLPVRSLNQSITHIDNRFITRCSLIYLLVDPHFTTNTLLSLLASLLSLYIQ